MIPVVRNMPEPMTIPIIIMAESKSPSCLVRMFLLFTGQKPTLLTLISIRFSGFSQGFMINRIANGNNDIPRMGLSVASSAKARPHRALI